FHSSDFGDHWELQPTGSKLPIHALQFVDDKAGWAVGELGTVLATTDGGQTWVAQRRGGQRAAVLLGHARPRGRPLATCALLGAADGLMSAAVRVTSADPETNGRGLSLVPARWPSAQRNAGGAAGCCFAAFPLPPQLGDANCVFFFQAEDGIRDDRAG